MPVSNFGVARTNFRSPKLWTPTDANAQAWANSTGATGARTSLVSNLIVSLKASGIWPLLDRLWLLANETATTALTDLVVLAAATPVSGPTFTTDQGYTTSATAYLNLGTIGGPNYTQDSAMIGFGKRDTDNPPTVIQMGTTNTSGGVISYVAIRASDTFCYADLNAVGAAADTTQATPSNGIWMLSRTGASGAGSSVLYRDAVSAASGSNPVSTGVPNQNFVLGGYLDSTGTFGTGGGASTQQFSMAVIGAGLTAAQISNLNAAIQTYLTAVGA